MRADGRPPRVAPGWGPALAAGALAFALAAAFLPRAPGIGDSAEFTLALALGGIPHPTGYPFYVLAGFPFVHAVHALGLGWAGAANLWSAVGAAVAAVAFARLLRHATGSDAALPQLLPVALLALHPVWMLSATVAEVYSWGHAWIAAAGAFVLGTLRALDDPERAASIGPRGTATRWGLLCGLGAAHHATSVFFALPLSLALLAGFRRAGRGAWVTIAYALAGVPVYLAGVAWLAWRAAHPAAFQWPLEATPAAIVAHLEATAYRGYLGGFAPSAFEWARIRDTLLPWILPGLPATALLALTDRMRPVRYGLLAFAGGAVGMVAFLFRYGVPDPSMFFLPALLASLVAVGLVFDRARRRIPSTAAWGLATLLVVAMAVWAIPGVNRERRRIAGADARIRAAWALIPFERGIVLWADDHVHRLHIFQLLEGQRPGLIVEDPAMLTWKARREEFARRAGFDPLAGREPRTRAEQQLVPEWIREQASVPVVDFPEFIERVPRAR